MKTVSFTHSAFYQVPVYRSLKISDRNRNQNLITVRFQIWTKVNFEWVQIKRGTLFEEFLDILSLAKSFLFSEAKTHEAKIHQARGSFLKGVNYLRLKVFSSDTVSFFLPFFLRDASTRRPFAEAILSLNPCLFFLFLFEGWYVLFIDLGCFTSINEGCKDMDHSWKSK
jgi:hypothetical protein